MLTINLETLETNLNHSRQVRANQEKQIQDLNLNVRQLKSQCRRHDDEQSEVSDRFRVLVDSILQTIKTKFGEEDDLIIDKSVDDERHKISQAGQYSLPEDFQRQYIRLESILHYLSNNISQHDSMKNLNYKINESKVELKETERALSIVEEKKYHAEEEISKLHKSIKSVSEDMAQKQGKLAVLNDEILEAEKHTFTLKGEIETMQLSLNAQEEATLKSIEASKAAGTHTHQLKAEAKELTEKNKELRIEIGQKERELVQVEECLRGNRKETLQLEEKYRSVQSSIRSEQDKARAILDNTRQLTQQNEDDRRDISRIRQDLLEREIHIQEKEEQLDSTMRLINQEKFQLDIKATSLRDEQDQINAIQQQLIDMQNVQVETEKAQEKMMDELKTRENNIANKENEVSSLHKVFDEQQLQLESKIQNMKKREEVLDAMEVDIHDHALELKVVEANLNKTAKDLEKKEKGISTAQKNLVEREKVINNREQINENMVKDYINKDKSLRLSIAKFENDQAELENEKKSLNLKKEYLDSEEQRLSEWADRISQLDEALQRRVEDAASKSAAISESESNLLERSNALDLRESQAISQEKKLENAMRTQLLEEKRIGESLLASRQEIDIIHSQMIDKQNQCREAEDNYRRITSDAQAIRSALKNKLSTAEKEVQSLMKKRNSSQEKLAGLRSEIIKVQAQKSQMQSEKEKEIQDLENKVSNFKLA